MEVINNIEKVEENKVLPPKKKKKSKLELFFMSLFFFSLMCLFLFIFVFMKFGVNLPDYNQLAEYKPPVTSRFYAGDGTLLTEYATEQRIYVPLKDVPPNLFLRQDNQNYHAH